MLQTNYLPATHDKVKLQNKEQISENHPYPFVLSGGKTRLWVYFHETEESPVKPADRYVAEIRWAILDAPPKDPGELVHSSILEGTPFLIEFPKHDRGKTIYLIARWEYPDGEKGEWSKILSAIIP